MAIELLTKRVPDERPVCLLGMGVSDLRGPGEIQKTLFDGEDRERQSRIDEVSDLAREMFGSQALQRGTSLDRGSGGEQPGGK